MYSLISRQRRRLVPVTLVLRLRPHFAACHPAGYEPHLLSSSSLRSCLSVFLIMFLSVSSCFSPILLAISIILNSSVSLLALSLQLLFLERVFSFKAEPNASHFKFCFFSSSCHLSGSSSDQLPSTADDRQWFWGLGFQSLLGHPVCLSVMARFNSALFFLTFDTGFPLSQAKKKKIWIHDASSLSDMVTMALNDSRRNHASKTSLSPLPTQGRSTSPPSIPQPFISLFTRVIEIRA